MTNKKSLALTENTLKRAGITDYTKVLNHLSDISKYIRLNATEQNLNVLSPQLNTMSNLLSCVNFVRRRALINENPKLANSITNVVNLVKENSVILIVGGFGTGKTLLLNTILDYLFRNTDTLFVSDTFDTANQVLNVNNNNADIISSFADKDTIFKHLSHRNLLIDELDYWSLDLFSKIDISITEKVIFTLHIPDVPNHSESSTVPSPHILDFSKQFYSLAMKLHSDLIVLDVNNGLEDIKTYTV